MRLFKISNAVKAVCNKQIAMAEDGVAMTDTDDWHKIWRELKRTATLVESIYMANSSRNASNIIIQHRRVLAQSNALNAVLDPEYLRHNQNPLDVLSPSSNNGTAQSNTSFYAQSCAQSYAQSNITGQSYAQLNITGQAYAQLYGRSNVQSSTTGLIK